MKISLFDSDLDSRPLDIVGIENAILDLLVQLDDESHLKELGLVKGTMRLVDTEEQRTILNHIGNLEPEIQAGGSCANVLRTMGRLGIAASYSSAVATDPQGESFCRELAAQQVVDRCARLGYGATGTSVILVTRDGERTMNTHLGVCRDYSPEHVPHDDIRQSKIFFTTGYIWDTPNQIDAIEAAIETARSAGCVMALDLADPFAVERSRAQIENHLNAGLDVVFANATEARMMTGHTGKEAAELLAQKARIAAVKDGANGCWIASEGEVFHTPTHQVEVVDTTGAGDCFAAGFLFGLLRRQPLELCAKTANFLAADNITHLGVRCSADIEQRLETIAKPGERIAG